MASVRTPVDGVGAGGHRAGRWCPAGPQVVHAPVGKDSRLRATASRTCSAVIFSWQVSSISRSSSGTRRARWISRALGRHAPGREDVGLGDEPLGHRPGVGLAAP